MIKLGQTIENLATRKLDTKAIFGNRFVIEICEKMHVHYRNFRIIQTLDDFVNMAEGFSAALDRWKKRGCPGTGKGVHIELTRKKVAVVDDSDDIAINLNKNLYNEHEGTIFSEGAEFTDKEYIHLKIRDTRVELSLKEFEVLSDAITEASTRLKNSCLSPML